MDKTLTVTIDKFNSEIFGKKMGNLVESINSDNAISDVRSTIEKAREDGFAHLTAKMSTCDKRLANLLLCNGFTIADTLVTWAFAAGKNTLANVEHKVQLGDCTKSDLPYLMKIAKESFKIDRFHSDYTLPDKLCDMYYEKWIENSFYGYADKIITARVDDKAVGFTTGNIGDTNGYAHLVLSAVSDKHRGMGIYTSMIHECVRWFFEARSSTNRGLLVGTQIDNIAVQKAWNRLGFVPFNSEYVLQMAIA